MKKTLLVMLLMLVGPVFAGVVDDAVQLEKAGLSNEVLLAWARQQKGYTISIHDMLRLNQNDVPGNVIAVLIGNASALTGSAAAEQPQPVEGVAPQIIYESMPSYYPEYTYSYNCDPYCNGYPDFGDAGYYYPDFGLNFGFGLDFGSGHHHHHHNVNTSGRAGSSTGSRAAASHSTASTRATTAQHLTASSSASLANTAQRSSTERSYSHSSSYSAPRSYSPSYSYSAPRSYSGYSGGNHGYSGGGFSGGFSGGGHGGGGHR